jgi:hypothetical protein
LYYNFVYYNDYNTYNTYKHIIHCTLKPFARADVFLVRGELRRRRSQKDKRNVSGGENDYRFKIANLIEINCGE